MLFSDFFSKIQTPQSKIIPSFKPLFLLNFPYGGCGLFPKGLFCAPPRPFRVNPLTFSVPVSGGKMNCASLNRFRKNIKDQESFQAHLGAKGRQAPLTHRKMLPKGSLR
jgi:hypothetical protein